MTSIASLGGASSQTDYFTNKINDLFSKADTSGDGALSLGEFSAAVKNLPGSTSSTGNNDPSSLFKAIDKNGDGSVSKDELSSYVKAQVTQAQTALLNLQELFNGTQGTQGHRRHHHHANSLTPTDTTGQSSTPTDPLSTLFQAIDGNSDGSVSKDELSSFLTKQGSAATSG